MNPTKITENQDKAQSVNGSRFVRYNGKCVVCGARVSVLAQQVWIPGVQQLLFRLRDEAGEIWTSNTYAPQKTCACGRTITTKPVRGVFRSSVVCNARCETSRAHVCECSCGGKNHGSHAGW